MKRAALIFSVFLLVLTGCGNSNPSSSQDKDINQTVGEDETKTTEDKTNKDVDYTTITSDKLETTIQLEVPKNKGIIKNIVGGGLNEVDFISEERGYRIAVFLYSQPYNDYESEKKSMKQNEGYKEITINDFKGYEYYTKTQIIITLSLGQAPTGFHRVYSLYINRRKDYDKPVFELMELEEIKTFVNSIKIVE